MLNRHNRWINIASTREWFWYIFVYLSWFFVVKAVQSTHYTLCMSSFVCLKHDFSAALKLSTSLCLCLCLVTRWTLAKLPYLDILVFRQFYKKSRRMTTTVTTSTFGTTAKGEEVTFCISVVLEENPWPIIPQVTRVTLTNGAVEVDLISWGATITGVRWGIMCITTQAVCFVMH